MFSRESLQNSSLMAVLTALGLAFLAWGGTQLYVNFCAPSGFSGFLLSLVTMDSSPCQALFAVVAHTQILYSAMIGSLLFAIIGGLGSCMASSQEKLPYAKKHA
jgi:hypothetical protein